MQKFLKFVFVALWALMIAPHVLELPVAGLAICAVALIVALLAPGRPRPWFLRVGDVNITFANGQLNLTVQTNDGICGIVLTGETGDDYTAGTPLMVTGMVDLVAQGITLAENPFAYRHIQEYYTEAGEGAMLYVMLVADTMTVAQIADNTNANGAKKLLNFARGAIKVLGIMTDDKAINTGGGTITITNGLNASVYTAAANMQTMATAFTALKWQFRCIIGGSSYSGSASALTAINSGTTYNRVGILIGDSQSYDATYCSAALGVLLGRVARIPVQRKISRVLDGPLTNAAVYFKTTAFDSTGFDWATIAGKGFITFKKYQNNTGFYFSGDPMYTATNDDYSFLCRGRIIDKAAAITDVIYTRFVDDEVPTEDNGLINAAYATFLEGKLTDALDINMRAKKEVTKVAAFIALNQNVISTGSVEVVTKVRPPGYATNINVTLGFEA